MHRNNILFYYLFHPLLYLVTGVIAGLLFYLRRPSLVWIAIVIACWAIPVWYARKQWLFLKRYNPGHMLEEDFIP